MPGPADLGTLRRAAVARLATAGSPTPALDVDVLLGNVLGRDRAFILAHPEYVLTPSEAARSGSLIDRAAAGEPIAYLIGRRGFYDLDFEVTPDVLIPRPETELLLEIGLAWARTWIAAHPGARLCAVDIGTGSGALAIALARHLPAGHTIVGIDVSPAALAVAARNRDRLLTDPAAVTLAAGDLLSDWGVRFGTPIHLLLANLPYIPSTTVPMLAVSRYEPTLALDGGPDGLVLVRRLLDQARPWLAAEALIALEIGADQGAAAADAVQTRLPAAQVAVTQDYAGFDRIVTGRLGAPNL